MCLVDQDSCNAWQVAKRVRVGEALAIEHVDAVGARVGDVHQPVRPVDVCVVAPWLLAGRDRNEADPGQCHAVVLPAATSFWHQA